MKQSSALRCRRPFSAFFRDRRGVAAVLFAMMLPTLLLSTGAAVDFARVGMLKTSMQAVTDGAALAGASALCLSSGTTDPTQAATDYYTKGTVPIARYATVGAVNVSIPSTIEVTVTATATLTNTLMQLVGMSETVSVTSSAEGPAYTISVTKTGGFTSSAADSDSIYFYPVSNSGVLPTSTSAMKLLFTNDPAVDPTYLADNAATKSISVGANDYVGFALVNKTGGISSYGANPYGGAQGSTHYFYSSAVVPSAVAYPTQRSFYTGQTSRSWFGQTSCSTTTITSSVTSYVPTASTSCYPHPCTEMSGTNVLNNNLLIGTSGTCSTPATATLTCLQLQATPLTFSWNDMGGANNNNVAGGGDDFDYNDAVYTVSCAPSTTASSQPNDVILVN